MIPFKIKIIEKLHTLLAPDFKIFKLSDKKFENSMISAGFGARAKLT